MKTFHTILALNVMSTCQVFAQFADDFNDGNFTSNPTWNLTPGGVDCWAPGTREVVNGKFHILDMDSPGCGHQTAIHYNLNMLLTNNTTLKFDVNPVYSDVIDGSGVANYEFPAQVILDLADGNNVPLQLCFVYNYRGGSNVVTSNYIQIAYPYVPQNVWQRNQTFRIRDIISLP